MTCIPRMRLFAASLLSLALAGPAAAADGAALYKDHCAKCHGEHGMSDTPVGKAMKAPHLAEVHPSAEMVHKFIRENPKHKSVSPTVTDADLDAIAAHIATFGK